MELLLEVVHRNLKEIDLVGEVFGLPGVAVDALLHVREFLCGVSGGILDEIAKRLQELSHPNLLLLDGIHALLEDKTVSPPERFWIWRKASALWAHRSAWWARRSCHSRS